jgi:phosphomannomutase
MTRDCLLPIIAPLAAAQAEGKTLSEVWDALPPVFTAADRLQGIETEKSKAFLAELSASPEARAAFLGQPDVALDETDGLRMTLAGGTVVHLRPSGNAPEFRCYAEGTDRVAAAELVKTVLAKVQARLG